MRMLGSRTADASRHEYWCPTSGGMGRQAESDECGALNDWLQLAPQAQPVCTLVGKLVSVDDFSIRPARGMTAEDVLSTGKYLYRFYRSPHIPRGWDAGVLFEETRKTLFCSDLFHHFGNVAPVTSSDLIEPTRKAMQQMQEGPLAGYMVYTRQTEGVLRSLADLKPETLAVMHGSSYIGQAADVSRRTLSAAKMAPTDVGGYALSANRVASQPERPVKRRNPIGVDGEFDRPRFTGNASDESPLFEPDQHGIH
ncbi:MAG: hypothetical protein NT154_12645 [Verrucomicrobia bacterium]|nr:hypothetical protein [Verrucomicrobiota bacterium]